MMNQIWTTMAATALVCAFTSCRSTPNEAVPSHAQVSNATAPQPVVAEPVADAPDKAELGKTAPDFTLKDLDGNEHKLSSYRGKLVVLEWFDPTCPYCEYAYGSGPLKDMPERCREQGIVWLTINSAGPANAGAAPEKNKKFAEQHKMKAPLLLDPTGRVGQAYGAKTTPHMFVINERGALVYRGALDNAPGGKPEASEAKVNYVDLAIGNLKAGFAVLKPDTKPYG
jgi:peroxiredoxin